MPKLVWDNTGSKYFETGVENGVLYVRNAAGAYPEGLPWNGLISVSESPSGAEPTPIYADNIKYLNLLSAEEFEATLEAYTYPEAFEACDGGAELAAGIVLSQQDRATFGVAYKTKIGNDVAGQELGYKLHIIYGAMASPTEKKYETVNDSPEAITFSWDVTTTKVSVTGKKPTAHLVIDSTRIDAAKLVLIEAQLFGTDVIDANLPLPDAILAIMEAA